jgi:probable H4MPT-linked C1 transfer pathway protein
VSRQPAGVLGLDVGGANLKVAHSSGVARSVAFALWRQPAALPHALGELLKAMPAARLVAVTMTGELCDCFATRREGVRGILDAVEQACGKARLCVWQHDGRFVSLGQARRRPLPVAAANWLALATAAARLVGEEPALLIDIGSTTTDIVPLHEGRPVPRARLDWERLRTRELVYTGVRRTPLCALLGPAVAAELFATTLDAYLLLGDLDEDAHDTDTADGRPATRTAARARLARMLCADAESLPEADCRALAETACHQQVRVLRRAVDAVAATLPRPPLAVVLAGSGEFLARLVLAAEPEMRPRQIRLSQHWSPSASQAACAHAVSLLAADHYGISP